MAALWGRAHHQCSFPATKHNPKEPQHRGDPQCLVGSPSLIPLGAWLIKLSQSRAAQSNFPAQHNPGRLLAGGMDLHPTACSCPIHGSVSHGSASHCLLLSYPWICIPLLALVLWPPSHPIHPRYQLSFVISQAWSFKQETAPGFLTGLLNQPWSLPS